MNCKLKTYQGDSNISPNDIDDGYLDNITPTKKLIFRLDKTGFTCADVVNV